jgi:L-aminopeptidase/D-esterase-like protein
MNLFSLSSPGAAWLVVAAVVFGSPVAHACSCVPAPPPLEAAAQATVVFVGTPVAEHPGEKNASRARKFEFAVGEILAGTGKATLMVSTGLNSASCGCHFEIGATYLVYAYGEVTTLQTNICTRTSRLTNKGVPNEVALLRDAKPAKPARK